MRSEVAFVAHQDAGHHGAHRVPATLTDPLGEALKRGQAGHVVHKDDGVYVAVIVLYHALPEALLPGCVPYLQLMVEVNKGITYILVIINLL